MKVFTFFVEPSSYTVDLINNIHNPMHIDYTFLKSDTLAKSTEKINASYIGSMSLFSQIKFLKKVHDNYDLIIFNGYDRWQFLFLFLFSKKKIIIAIDSDTPAKEDPGIKGLIKKTYLRFVFSYRTLGFAGGNYGHKELFSQYGMKSKNIFLMPMMVNNKKFNKPFENIKFPHNQPFHFLYVGRIIPHKNVEIVIKSFIKAFGNNQKYILNIVGKGSSLPQLKKRYGHLKNINFKGPRYGQDLILEYHNAHALVLPSLAEPWGLVVNEAMSAGLPVIASNKVGAGKDLIKDGEAGLIFNVEKQEELIEKMKQLATNPELYTKLARNAYSRMHDHWNYDLYKKNLLKAIEYSKYLLHKGQS